MTLAHSLPITPTVARRQSPEGRLRLVLAANAATSIAGGLAGLVAAGWFSTKLGVDNTLVVRLVSAALLLFGVDVALAAAKAKENRLAQAALAISTLDLVWVAASIVIVVAGWLSTFGNVVAVALAVGVADFAIAQLWFRRAMCVGGSHT